MLFRLAGIESESGTSGQPPLEASVQTLGIASLLQFGEVRALLDGFLCNDESELRPQIEKSIETSLPDFNVCEQRYRHTIECATIGIVRLFVKFLLPS